MSWYLEVLKKYAVFKGRARRKEYWMFVLFNTIFIWILEVIGVFMQSPVLACIYSLAVMLPGLGVTIRRLHDTGRAGWWVLIALIPVVGQIWLFVLVCLEGQSGENQYGEDPKAEAAKTQL